MNIFIGYYFMHDFDIITLKKIDTETEHNTLISSLFSYNKITLYNNQFILIKHYGDKNNFYFGFYELQR